MRALKLTLDYVQQLAAQGFWGLITVKFENGKVVHLRREENIKPMELNSQLPGTIGRGIYGTDHNS